MDAPTEHFLQPILTYSLLLAQGANRYSCLCVEWGLCPTTVGGVQRYRREICAELADAFAESVSRADKVSAAKAVSGFAAQLEKADQQQRSAEDPCQNDQVDLQDKIDRTMLCAAFSPA
eukprot:g29973.t2